MAASAITPVGGSQPHENMQPYLVVSYIISLFGIFRRQHRSRQCPTRSSPRSASLPATSPPQGWALCNGQLLPISQNTALFSLLGTFYGGDGKSTFALPDMQGNAPIHQGQGAGLSEYFLGQMAGPRPSPCSKPRCRPTPISCGGNNLLAEAAVPTTACHRPAVLQRFSRRPATPISP